MIGMALHRTVFTSSRTSMTLHIPEGPRVPLTVVTLVTTRRPFDEAGELYYLQVIRQFPWLLEGELMAARCQMYVDHVGELAQLAIAAGVQECDTMIGVPTMRGELLLPYLRAARGVNPAIADVTGLIRRDPGAGSTCKLSFAERQAGHGLMGALPVMHRALVLDDFLASGESVAHIIELVRQHTTSMPEFVIAAPLWVPSKEPSASFLR